MEEFQQVRNRFPQSEWAAPALERITALYRLFGGAKPTFSVDPAFSMGAGDVLKDVKALARLPGGRFWIASGRTKSAVQYQAGKIAASITADEPRSLALTPRGEIVLAAASAVRIGPKDIRSFATPPEKAGDEPGPLTAITAAAIAPGGAMLVADEDREQVLRFDATGRQYLGTFPPNDTAKRKVTRILVDGESGIFTLDREEKTRAAVGRNRQTVAQLRPGRPEEARRLRGGPASATCTSRTRSSASWCSTRWASR